MPFFSVIIPLYNKEQSIADTLKSILVQEFADFEIVIADDGSTDASAKIVKGFTDARIKYLYKENGGVSSARNYAMEQATGSYFAFIDADDYWYPYHLQELYNAIHQMPHLKVFSALIEAETPHGVHVPEYTNLTDGPLQEVDFFKTSLIQAVLTTQSTAIHRSVPAATGYFDTSLTICEDTDYWIRVGFEYKVGLVNKVTARHKYVPNSLSNSTFSIDKATFYEKFTEKEKTRPDAKKMIDVNRFSLALKCRLTGDVANSNKLISMIAPENLQFKQRLLLQLPPKVLKIMLSFKNYLESKGIRLTAF
jgi:glycosyltransferase involved in cell wall biosynthesis